jgi:hypothetical protein
LSLSENPTTTITQTTTLEDTTAYEETTPRTTTHISATATKSSPSEETTEVAGNTRQLSQIASATTSHAKQDTLTEDLLEVTQATIADHSTVSDTWIISTRKAQRVRTIQDKVFGTEKVMMSSESTSTAGHDVTDGLFSSTLADLTSGSKFTTMPMVTRKHNPNKNYSTSKPIKPEDPRNTKRMKFIPSKRPTPRPKTKPVHYIPRRTRPHYDSTTPSTSSRGTIGDWSHTEITEGYRVIPDSSMPPSSRGLFAGLVTAAALICVAIIVLGVWAVRWLCQHRSLSYNLSKEEDYDEFSSVPYRETTPGQAQIESDV